jgi:uncharacterized repeat protein (TIGR04138 family)
MQKPNFSESLGKILKQDGRYDHDAYYFVREGLDFTLKMLKKESPGPKRHVTGQELLEGLRRYALHQFGPMTKTVLNYWGVRQCEDFAEIVFNMVDEGILGKSEHDRREDFKNGYDFDEAFVKPYRPPRRASVRHACADTRATAKHLAASPRSSGAKKMSSGSN